MRHSLAQLTSSEQRFSIQERIGKQLEQIATDISDCSNACGTFQKRNVVCAYESH